MSSLGEDESRGEQDGSNLVPADTEGGDLVSAAIGDFDDGSSEGRNRLRKFQPWHLPRKHYCRLEQWVKLIDRLVKKLSLELPTKKRPLRYLTLPGDELLDIRIIHDTVLTKYGLRMAFIGFNSTLDPGRTKELKISLSEVRGMPWVLEGSDVVRDAIERLGRESSKTRDEVARFMSLDVVNLDFTSSIGGDKPFSENSTLDMLRWVIEEQCGKRSEPWLLLITTPLNRSATNAQSVNGLWKAVLRNMDDQSFRDLFEKRLGVDRVTLQQEISREQVAVDESSFSLALCMAFLKWVLGIVTTRGDGWAVSLPSNLKYRVASPSPDMFSIAMQFERTPRTGIDDTGLTPSRQVTQKTESEQALEMLQALIETEDVDLRLLEDSATLDRVTKLSAKLMNSARFDPEEYSQWVAQEMEERRLLDREVVSKS